MPTAPQQYRWLIPTSAVLTVVGLVLLVLAIAAQAWWVVVGQACVVVSSGLTLSSQLRIRRRARAGDGDAA